MDINYMASDRGKAAVVTSEAIRVRNRILDSPTPQKMYLSPQQGRVIKKNLVPVLWTVAGENKIFIDMKYFWNLQNIFLVRPKKSFVTL